MLAASRGHRHIVQALLNRGVDVNAKNEHHNNAFSWAISNCHMEMCRLLVEHGVDVNLPDVHTLAPIHYAVMRKDQDLTALEFLLENGGDVHAKTGRGETPLTVVRGSNRSKAIELLKAHGARK